MAESTQHKLDRIRPPRVQITYDVETRGSFVKRELPFVVGIMADLSGDNTADRPHLRDRKYLDLDRDNFNDIMKSIAPSISLNGGSKSLEFRNLDDFSPIKVLKQIDAKAQFEKRTHLSDMVAKLDGNVKLQKAMLEALSDDKQRAAMKVKVEEIKALLDAKTDEPPKNPETPVAPTEGGR